MRSTIILAFLVFFIPGAVISGEKGLQESKYVGLEVRLVRKELKSGETANLLIKFKPRKGIHINSVPPVEIKLDTADAIISAGKPEIPAVKKGDYFDVSKPIRQSFALSKNLKPGVIKLNGILTYFYCSEAEGWCRKFKHPFEFSIKIIK